MGHQDGKKLAIGVMLRSSRVDFVHVRHSLYRFCTCCLCRTVSQDICRSLRVCLWLSASGLMAAISEGTRTAVRRSFIYPFFTCPSGLFFMVLIQNPFSQTSSLISCLFINPLISGDNPFTHRAARADQMALFMIWDLECNRKRASKPALESATDSFVFLCMLEEQTNQ